MLTTKNTNDTKKMRIHIDLQNDALFLRLDESPIIESAEVQPEVVLDFNAENQVVGIEILKLKDKLPHANLKQIQFDFA